MRMGGWKGLVRVEEMAEELSYVFLALWARAEDGIEEARGGILF